MIHKTSTASSILIALLLSACSTLPTEQKNNHTAVIEKIETLSRDLAAARSKQVAHLTYILWLGLDSVSPDFSGRLVVNVDLKEKFRDASKELPLDFHGGSIQSLILNERAVPAEELQERYDGRQIHLKTRELQTGSNRIEVVFTHPYSKSGYGLNRFEDPADKNVYVYSHVPRFHAHEIFPCFDQPDLKASYELTVEVPEEWTVISATPEREVTKVEGNHSWAFPPTPLFSTYLFTVHAGPFTEWTSEAEGIPLRLFARESIAEEIDGEDWFGPTRRGLSFLPAEFGYPYPFSKYDQVIVPGLPQPQQENAATGLLSESLIRASNSERTPAILHPLIHMWLGDLVTVRWWNSLWLQESLSTLMTARALSAPEGEAKTESSTGNLYIFKSEQRSYDLISLPMYAVQPLNVSAPDTQVAYSLLDDFTRAKGLSAMKTLNYYLETDNFREGIQRYLQRFPLRNTTLADLLLTLGEAAGTSTKEMNDWQLGWLQSGGLDTVTAEWSCKVNEKGKSILSSLALRVTPDKSGAIGPHRTHKMDVGVLTRVKRSLSFETFSVTAGAGETSISAAVGKPCPVAVIPNYGNHDSVKATLDSKTLSYVKRSLYSFEDPSARLLIWRTLWKEALDQNSYPAVQDFLALALSVGFQEKDPTVLSWLLKTMINHAPGETSAWALLKPEDRTVTAEAIEKRIRLRLDAAPGTALQRTWFEGYLEALTSERGINILHAVLNEKRKIKGLMLDQSLRWKVIQAVARAGSSWAPELITEELEIDNTLQGKLEATKAEAMSMEPELKMKWLALINNGIASALQEGKASAAEIRVATENFYQLGQGKAPQETMEKFLEDVARLSKTENEEDLRRFVRNMYPSHCDARNAGMTDQFIEQNVNKLPIEVLRGLKLRQQLEERCLKFRGAQGTTQSLIPTTTGQ